MPRFIFMLTRDDETVPDALALYEEAAASGVEHFGCKDVGLPLEDVGRLIENVRRDGHTSYLEVVAETDEGTLQSARAAAELRPDYLIGGSLIEPVQEILAGTGVRFFPYVGAIVDHPCLLRGSVQDISEDAAAAARAGVDGINLLAYRYDGDVDELVRSVAAASPLPMICAGSVDTVERVAALAAHGVWAFTVGTAVLDGSFADGAPLAGQLEAVLRAAGETTPEGAAHG